MSDIVDFVAQGDTDLRPALERACAEVERLLAEVNRLENVVVDTARRDPRIARVQAEVERLRSQNAELSEARRNLEARLNAELREAGAEVGRLKAAVVSVTKMGIDRCNKLEAANAELLAALKIARRWMPFRALIAKAEEP